MAKITLTDIDDIKALSAASAINANSARIEEAFENTLSRDGTSPNTMEADLDMNSNRLLNLPIANSSTEPVRKLEFDSFVTTLLVSGTLTLPGGAGAVVTNSGGVLGTITGTDGTVLRANAAGNQPSFDTIENLLTLVPVAKGGTGATTAAAARTNLGLVIGTNVQAWDADLDIWAGKTAPASAVVGISDIQTLTNKTINLTSNTLSGTLAQFNTAVSDADLVSLAGSETLTNKTLTAPTLTSPILGTPASGILTNCTGLPVSTGISGLGTGIATFLATPTSANLASAITNETGSGALVFATSPTLVTPVLGTPASGTLTNCTGLPLSTGISGFGTGVATFLATPSSANLASAVTDETGSGALVFATSPTLVTPNIGVATATSINGVTVDNSAWTTYTPTISAQSGTFTTASASGRYQQRGKTLFWQVSGTITTPGTGSGGIIVSMPAGMSLPAGWAGALSGSTAAGVLIGALINSTNFGNNVVIFKYDATSIIGVSVSFSASGVIEIA